MLFNEVTMSTLADVKLLQQKYPQARDRISQAIQLRILAHGVYFLDFTYATLETQDLTTV